MGREFTASDYLNAKNDLDIETKKAAEKATPMTTQAGKYQVTKVAGCPYGIFCTTEDRFVAYNIEKEPEAFLMAKALNEAL